MDDEPSTKTVTGYDTTERKVFKRTLHFDAKWPEEFRLTTKVRSLDLQTVSDSDTIMVAADVLANGIHRHFRSRAEDELYEDLNRPVALTGHPLAKSLDTFWNWCGRDLIGDGMFRHPKALPTR